MATRRRSGRKENPADIFAFQLKAAGVVFMREWTGWHEPDPLHPKRKWRVDFAITRYRPPSNIFQTHLAVEVDGGLFVKGGHNRGAYIEDTMEKTAELLKMGIPTLRVSPRHVTDGRALQWVEQILSRT